MASPYTAPLHVKMTCKDDIRRFKLTLEDAEESSRAQRALEVLLDKAAGAYGISPEQLRFSYKDDEGDLVTIATAEDMALALEMTSADPLFRVAVSQLETAATKNKPRHEHHRHHHGKDILSQMARALHVGHGKHGGRHKKAGANEKAPSSGNNENDDEEKSFRGMPKLKGCKKYLKNLLFSGTITDEQRKALKHAVLASWPPPPAADDEHGQKNAPGAKPLPDAVRQALKEHLGHAPLCMERLRRVLRAAWFGEELPAGVGVSQSSSGSSGDDGKETTTTTKFPPALRPFKEALKRLLPKGEQRKALKEAVRASWPPVPEEEQPVGPKTLPVAVRQALRPIDQPAQFRLRMLLRAAWFGEPLPSDDDEGRSLRPPFGGFRGGGVGWGGRGGRGHGHGGARFGNHGDGDGLQHRKWLARFVQHVTVPDEAPIPVGTDFNKTWKIRNDAGTPWPAECTLICVSAGATGEPLFTAPTPVGVALAPGETAEVSVNLTAPTKPGLYEAWYRLAGPMGKKFGQRLRVAVLATEEDNTPDKNDKIEENTDLIAEEKPADKPDNTNKSENEKTTLFEDAMLV